MAKRHGQLFDKCFTMEALYNAYLKARSGKRSKLPVQDFELDLGANLQKLHDEIHSGTYHPKPYRRFMVWEPKPREISAPAFRDTVVQHAIYAVIYPIFDATFIHDSYGCRKGKGTHLASDRAQQYLRESRPDTVTLQMDIRRYYYSIVHSILEMLVRKKIKDERMVKIIMMFAVYGDIGVPIGSLLSQLDALIYLNPLDHFIKRELKAKKYVRYVDDFIIFDISRAEAKHMLARIEAFLAEHLQLELSRWTIAPTSKGVNFVGFRTWHTRRFVRKHSLFTFSRSLKRGDIPSLTSIMGNAINTSSFSHMARRYKTERPDLPFPNFRGADHGYLQIQANRNNWPERHHLAACGF